MFRITRMKDITDRKWDGILTPALVAFLIALSLWAVRPRFNSSTPRAKFATARTQILNFQTALDHFDNDNGFYPVGPNGLLDLIKKPAKAKSWTGPYLKTDTVPKDPWGRDFVYIYPGQHNVLSYDLYSLGPPGENSMVRNW